MERRQQRPRLLQAMVDAFSLPDLRKRILITLFILVVFRLVAHVPLPGVDRIALRDLFESSALLGMLNLFSGGAMQNFSIAAMGVYPYITATIIMQLMQPVIPKLQALAMEGEAGRNKIGLISHILTVPLAAFSGYGQIIIMQRANVVAQDLPMLTLIGMIMALVAGTMFLIWLGELITENGIGNGISIIIFAGIVATIPTDIAQGFLARDQFFGLALWAVIALATTVSIVIFTEAHRRIPVQYTRSIYRGGRMYRQGGSTHIPLRVNMTGMIPLIFSMSMVLFPGLIASYFQSPPGPPDNFADWLVRVFDPGAAIPLGLIYWGLFFLLTFGFAFFYTAIIFQQQDLPNTLQKQGGFIPGVRPGKQTSVYLNGIINRITWAGALFLSVMAVTPFIAREATGIQALQLSSIGMLIVVGVVLDTMKQLEAQLVMRRYEGFLK
jgi:preprotein translocase subunit SecY